MFTFNITIGSSSFQPRRKMRGSMDGTITKRGKKGGARWEARTREFLLKQPNRSPANDSQSDPISKEEKGITDLLPPQRRW